MNFMSEIPLDRRNFLRGATALTALSYSRVMGANDRIQLGLIGCGDRGRYDMGNFQKANADVVALCDIYGAQIDKARENAPNAKDFKDHRALLEMKEVDVALIATPDHWHAQIAIDALNAGKDVYVEKPLTRTIEEGPRIVKAARVNERVCQVGMQQRSGQHYLQAKREYFDTGKLGKITLARTWWHGNGYHLRNAPESLRTQAVGSRLGAFPGTAEVARLRSAAIFQLARVPGFRRRPGDRPVHPLDRRGAHVHGAGSASRRLRRRAACTTIRTAARRRTRSTCCWNIPTEFTATFEATLVPGITGAAVEMCGTEGRLLIDRGHYEFHPVGRDAKPVTVKAFSKIDEDHVNNFLECVRSRQRPNGDVLIGHRSAQASHLGNISYMQKRRIDFDPVREEIQPF